MDDSVVVGSSASFVKRGVFLGNSDSVVTIGVAVSGRGRLDISGAIPPPNDLVMTPIFACSIAHHVQFLKIKIPHGLVVCSTNLRRMEIKAVSLALF